LEFAKNTPDILMKPDFTCTYTLLTSTQQSHLTCSGDGKPPFPLLITGGEGVIFGGGIHTNLNEKYLGAQNM
jgi:hypothetical protein